MCFLVRFRGRFHSPVFGWPDGCLKMDTRLSVPSAGEQQEIASRRRCNSGCLFIISINISIRIDVIMVASLIVAASGRSWTGPDTGFALGPRSKPHQHQHGSNWPPCNCCLNAGVATRERGPKTVLLRWSAAGDKQISSALRLLSAFCSQLAR